MMPLVFAKIMYFGAAVGSSCTPNSGQLFFLPHWWEYLPTQIDNTGNCSPVVNSLNDTWSIGLAVLDILLRIGGFAAVISIMIAGVQYITAIGNPEKGTSARKRLTNSLIGLAIVLVASGIVAFIGNRFA